MVVSRVSPKKSPPKPVARTLLGRSVIYDVIDKRPMAVLKAHPNIRRGDVVHVGDDDYRNMGKYLWDGKKAIELDYTIDDYGALPSSFTLNEFPDPRYFNESIDHNTIRWIQFTEKDIIDYQPGAKGNFKVEITADDGKLRRNEWRKFEKSS